VSGFSRTLASGFSRTLASGFSRTLAFGIAFAILCVQPTAADVIATGNTPHLSFTASLSPDVVRTGGKLSLVVNITPKKKMHVYAPGTQYRPVTVTLNSTAWLKPGKTEYQKASFYIFKPLKEQVLVYSERFKLTTNVTLGTIPARLKQVRITGALSYQACDDRVCYLPQSVPLEWVVAVRR
jgi:hypothetical protein